MNRWRILAGTWLALALLCAGQDAEAERAVAAEFRDLGARVWVDRAGRITEINANGRPVTDAHLARLEKLVAERLIREGRRDER